MKIDKTEIRNKICYTELVYGRINKKLQSTYSKTEIKFSISEIISKTDIRFFEKIGKNIYVSNQDYNIKITINSNTFRVITVDKY